MQSLVFIATPGEPLVKVPATTVKAAVDQKQTSTKVAPVSLAGKVHGGRNVDQNIKSVDQSKAPVFRGRIPTNKPLNVSTNIPDGPAESYQASPRLFVKLSNSKGSAASPSTSPTSQPHRSSCRLSSVISSCCLSVGGCYDYIISEMNA